MSSDSFVFTFPDASTAEGNRLAGSLTDALRDVDPTVVVERQRERLDTQDFGATLAVVIGTAAATAIGKGIATWLARNSGAKVVISRRGEVVLTATHVDSHDVPKIVEAISRKA